MPTLGQNRSLLRLIRWAQCAAIFAALAGSLPIVAAEAPAAASTTAKALPVKAAPGKVLDEKKADSNKPEETLLFTERAGKRLALGRTDAAGHCKAFLGHNGEGWLPFPDPKVEGDDYLANVGPDGTRFVLLSNRTGSLNYWLVSADGRNFERLTDDDAGVIKASDINGQVMAFSPDNKLLAFVMRGEAWIMNLKDRQPRVLTKGGKVRALAFSPDNKWVAVVQGQSVRRIATSGQPMQLLASDACDQPSLAWNPDPKADELYFFGRGVQRVNAKRQVDLVAPSTSRPNQVTLLPPASVALLAPSNSGQAEVFVAGIAGAKGAAFTQVTQGGAEAVWASANGKTLFFLRERVLWRCDLSGLKAKPLGSVPVGHVTLGALPPLKGVCP